MGMILIRKSKSRPSIVPSLMGSPEVYPEGVNKNMKLKILRGQKISDMELRKRKTPSHQGKPV